MSEPPAAAFEATAPCVVALAGGSEADTSSLAVAIDRRVLCRVEAGGAGVSIESKDTLGRSAGAAVGALEASGPIALVKAVLQALGIETGVRVVTHCRVPLDAGLRGRLALASAVAAAASAALGRRAAAETLATLVRGAEPGSAAEALAVWRGGLAGASAARPAAAERLPVDPARVEESLILVDTLVPGAELASVAPGAEWAAAPWGDRVQQALCEGRYGDVARIWNEEADASPALRQLVDPSLAARVRRAGGAVRPCGRDGRIVAIWATPGERRAGCRERVLEELREAKARVFPARLELRGLELESA